MIMTRSHYRTRIHYDYHDLEEDRLPSFAHSQHLSAIPHKTQIQCQHSAVCDQRSLDDQNVTVWNKCDQHGLDNRKTGFNESSDESFLLQRDFNLLKIDCKESINSVDSSIQNRTSIREEPVFDNIEEMDIVSEIFRGDEDGDTRLHMAIIQKLQNYCLCFISMAPSPHWLTVTNNLSQTALHLAVLTRQSKIVRRLMVAGADLDVMDSKGNTPLHIACCNGYTEIVEILLEPIRCEELSQNQYNIPHQNIPQNLDVRNYDGHTCLHLATQNSDLDIISILVSSGANINAMDGKSGRTILHYAAESCNVSLLKSLVALPYLNMNAETFAGETPLILASGRSSVEMINILMSHGARWPTTDKNSDIEDIIMNASYTNS